MVRSMMHIYITRPQWVNSLWPSDTICHQGTSVYFDPSNGLLPDSTKPLPEPTLTNHHWGLVSFTWGQFCRKRWNYLSLIWDWKLPIKIRDVSPGGFKKSLRNYLRQKDVYTFFVKKHVSCYDPGLILGLRPANERRRYLVMTSLIGWAQT